MSSIQSCTSHPSHNEETRKSVIAQLLDRIIAAEDEHHFLQASVSTMSPSNGHSTPSIPHYKKLDDSYVDVKLNWSRTNQQFDSSTMLLITKTGSMLDEDSRIFSEKMFGNGQFIRFYEMRGKYVHVSVEFDNRFDNPELFVFKRIAIPASMVSMTKKQRLRSILATIRRPCFKYTSITVQN
jgi:hypothetical protein